MKRKLKWTAAVLAVLLLGFSAALFLWPRDRITAESWKVIRVGMTEKEVEEILGAPAMVTNEFNAKNSQYYLAKGTIISFQLFEPTGDWPDDDPEKTRFWQGGAGFIEIGFSRQGLVVFKGFGAQPSNPNVVDRIRDWLGW